MTRVASIAFLGWQASAFVTPAELDGPFIGSVGFLVSRPGLPESAECPDVLQTGSGDALVIWIRDKGLARTS